MKHLLRKRTNSISSPSSSAPPHPISNVSAPGPSSPSSPTGETPVTPLYARFATSSKPVVSGPIALAPRRAGQAPAPAQIQRGASSQSEKEREREREQEEAVVRERERKKSVGAEREPRGILKRDEARLGEGSRAQGREETTREVGRKPSNGEGLLVPSTSTSTSGNGHAGEDTGVGMHGARVRGERVLLPARKVTQRRRGEEAARALETPAHTREDQQARGRRENSPVKSGAEGEGGYLKEQPPHARRTGDRVLLPARKVARRRVHDDGGPAQAGPAASASGRPPEDAFKEASVSSPRPSQEAPAAAPIVFPAPARAAGVAASPDHDDGEDRFSTPKRAHMTPVSSPGMASSTPSASSGPPRPALGTPKDSESSRIARAAGSSAICAPSSQGPANAAIENEARVVGDRVLLPARKVARRIVEGEKEKERSPERGRTMSAGRSSRIRQEKSTGASDLEAGHASPAAKTTRLNVFPERARSRSASPSRSARGIAPGPEHAAGASSTSTSTSTSKPVAPSLTSQPSTSSVETNGRPPRRRKYSLLAAFGLPSRGASESESSTPAASTDVHSAKPPTPTPPPPPPDPAPLAPPAVDVQPPVTSPSTPSGPDSAGEPRQRLASTARRPPPEVQLHSLHLSGFNFSLDAILGDATCANLDDPPPVPPVPASQPSPALLPTVSKRRSTVDSLPVPASSSPPDPPVPVTGTASPLQPSASLGHASKAQSPSLPTQPAAAPHPEPPARPAHAPPAPIQAPRTKTKARAIDLDQSLLSPESDTRYPLPSRRSPTSQPRPQKPPSRSSPMKSEQPVAVPNARGPVQGRPLIFAAMAAAEAEAEIVEPRMWMAVATSDSDSQDDGDVKDVRTEHSNGSSQFVNGYPTPRSASPRLPAATSSDEGHGPPALATSTNVRAGREDDGRRPSPSLPQSPPTATGNLPSPPDPQPTRTRKLSKSKSRVTRMADASQVPSQPPTQTPSHSLSYGHAPNTLGAKPPTPVEDAPPVRTRDGPSKSVPKPSPVSSNGASSNSSPSTTTSLASPFQMRGDKHAMERRHAESRSPPRVISSESPVPTRPVKMLTERQMEKLSATKGVPMHGSNGHSSQRRPEQSGPHVKSPTPRNKQLTPLTPPDEPPAVQHSRSRSSDDALPPPPPKRRPADVSVSSPQTSLPEPPLSPTTPEEYARARSRRRGQALEKSRPEGIEDVATAPDDPAEEEPKEPTFYPLEKHVAEPALLGQLVGYLPFSDWLALSSVSKTVRSLVHGDRELAERVLERYLRTVGYARWSFPESEPISLTLADLNAYMHAVSLPQHQFARYADMYLHDRRQREVVRSLQAACRSYTRVVLRLRAQAEAEARVASAMARDRARSPARGWGASTTSVNHVPTPKKSFSRSSSRAPSPTSMYSRSQHGHGYGHSRAGSEQSLHHNPSVAQFHGPGSPPMNSIFQSPLFRIRRAPLLQVFVPSPEGEWLSDASVLECEEELKRAGVTHLLRAGDIVWDIAVGDEANVGRMVWDGSYLIDLDYTYSRSGDLPKYLPTLAFPPSYFHRVVRTMGSGNPICHIDIAPWGEEIATNLQLLQDRMKTETPQGGHHMVVRWVHRSSFTIRPSSSGKALRVSVPQCVGPGPGPGGIWLVDPGWYGTVVVEAEGTNEGLADLQERCRGAFPIRAMGAAAHVSVSPERAAREEERRMVFRILREKSRPGEIWIRTVTAKERLLPP